MRGAARQAEGGHGEKDSDDGEPSVRDWPAEKATRPEWAARQSENRPADEGSVVDEPSVLVGLASQDNRLRLDEVMATALTT